LNNYSAAIISNYREAGSDYRKSLDRKIEQEWEKEVPELTLQGCLDINDKPESKHVITLDNNNFEVTATVKGNEIPYIHHIPYLLDEDSFLVDIGDSDVIMLYTKVFEIPNGDVASQIFKVTATWKHRYTAKQLAALPKIHDGFMKIADIYEGSDDTIERTVSTNDTMASAPSTDITIASLSDNTIPNIYNDDLYNERKSKAGDKEFNPAKYNSRVASEIAFVRWMRRQLFNRGSSHLFSLRIIDGEVYIVARKLGRWFFKIFVAEWKAETALAKVSDVIDAYLTIGVKSNETSIRHAQVTDQRASKDKTLKVLNAGDAFAIARLLRIAEEHRFTLLTSDVTFSTGFFA